MNSFGLNFTADYFALFGLPRVQALDLAALEARFREIQAQIHPDRHVQGSDAEQRLAMQWTTRVNEAFQVLKQPGARARYLLQLLGHDAQVESNTAMPLDFLTAQMELRESVVAARAAGDEAGLEETRLQLLTDIRSEQMSLTTLIDVKQDYEQAKGLVRQLMFQEKLLVEVDEALESVIEQVT